MEWHLGDLGVVTLILWGAGRGCAQGHGPSWQGLVEQTLCRQHHSQSGTSELFLSQ